MSRYKTVYKSKLYWWFYKLLRLNKDKILIFKCTNQECKGRFKYLSVYLEPTDTWYNCPICNTKFERSD